MARTANGILKQAQVFEKNANLALFDLGNLIRSSGMNFDATMDKVARHLATQTLQKTASLDSYQCYNSVVGEFFKTASHVWNQGYRDDIALAAALEKVAAGEGVSMRDQLMSAFADKDLSEVSDSGQSQAQVDSIVDQANQNLSGAGSMPQDQADFDYAPDPQAGMRDKGTMSVAQEDRLQAKADDAVIPMGSPNRDRQQQERQYQSSTGAASTESRHHDQKRQHEANTLKSQEGTLRADGPDQSQAGGDQSQTSSGGQMQPSSSGGAPQESGGGGGTASGILDKVKSKWGDMSTGQKAGVGAAGAAGLGGLGYLGYKAYKNRQNDEDQEKAASLWSWEKKAG